MSTGEPMSQTVFVRVTAKSRPAVFRAFLEIDYDNGAVNRFEPERKFCDVPEPYIASLALVEASLAALTPEQLNEFCCGGDDSTMRNPADAGLIAADELLNAYFEDFTV